MNKHSYAAENTLYVLNLLISALVVAGLAIVISAAAKGGPAASSLTLFLTYIVIIIVYVFFAKGILIGRVRGNGVRVTPEQFPEVYAIYKGLLEKLRMRKEPRLYCVQSNGVLNAFATRMLFRNYIVVYSEILQAAYEEGQDALAFVLAHEIGHVRRGHLYKNFFIAPAYILLPLRLAYSRACEYGCDAIGQACTAERGLAGLLILAAGRALAGRVNVHEYLERAQHEGGFWVWFAEFMSSHPNLPKRVRRVRDGEPRREGNIRRG